MYEQIEKNNINNQNNFKKIYKFKKKLLLLIKLITFFNTNKLDD